MNADLLEKIASGKLFLILKFRCLNKTCAEHFRNIDPVIFHRNIISKYTNKNIIDSYNTTYNDNISMNIKQWISESEIHYHISRNNIYWNISKITENNKPWITTASTSRINIRTIMKKQWRENGILHNENGPACKTIRIIDKTIKITKKWYVNGKLHNFNGPAVIKADNIRGVYKLEWYISDIKQK